MLMLHAFAYAITGVASGGVQRTKAGRQLLARDRATARARVRAPSRWTPSYQHRSVRGPARSSLV